MQTPPQRHVDSVNQLAFTHALGKAHKGAQVPFGFPFCVVVRQPSVIAYFGRLWLANHRSAAFRGFSPAGLLRKRVPVPWYRKLLRTACTGLVLKTGLTYTFSRTSMGKVANHPPRFRSVGFLFAAGQG